MALIMLIGVMLGMYAAGFVIGRWFERADTRPDHFPSWTRYSATCVCDACRGTRDVMTR